MIVNAVKGMIRKFEEIGSGRCTGKSTLRNQSAMVEENTIATVEVSARSSNALDRSIAR